jgi:hypothetical protein
MNHKIEEGPFPDFRFDLEALNFTELRKKYLPEYGTHCRFLRICRKNCFEIDERWIGFSEYLRDMEPKPSPKHVAGFVDANRKIFGPGNFRWLTMAELAAQRPGASVVEFEGVRTTVKAVADQLGLSQAAVRYAWRSNSLPKLFEQANKSDKSLDLIWRYPGPKSEADFSISFNDWRKKTVDEQDKRAFPDVYFYLSGMITLSIIEKKLGLSGFTDFSDVSQLDHWRLKYLNGSLEATFNQYSGLRSRLLEALKSIAKRDQEFARSITPVPGTLEAHQIALLLRTGPRQRAD